MQLDNKRGYACGKELQVDKKVITFRDSIIYAENISLITISKPPANMSFIGAMILSWIGILLISAGDSFRTEDLKAFGIYLLITGVIWFIVVMVVNFSRNEYLVINLNSGVSLIFYCPNREFLNRAVEILIRCINENPDESVIIQFDKCAISGGNFFNESTL